MQCNISVYGSSVIKLSGMPLSKQWWGMTKELTMPAGRYDANRSSNESIAPSPSHGDHTPLPEVTHAGDKRDVTHRFNIRDITITVNCLLLHSVTLIQSRQHDMWQPTIFMINVTRKPGTRIIFSADVQWAYVAKNENTFMRSLLDQKDKCH